MRTSLKTYGCLTRTGDCWTLAEIEPHVALRLKQLFPRIPKWAAGTFTLPDTLDVCADLSWFLERYCLQTETSCARYLKKRTRMFYRRQTAAEEILLPDRTPTERAGLKPGQALRSYQKTALDLIEKVQSLLLIDDIGLGKSYESLGVGLLPGTLPMVVVMEPHLQDQWQEKATEFIALSTHQVKGNTPYSLPPADIYLFKYTQLAPWVDVLTQGWVKAIVFDEVQQLRRGTESGKGQAAAAICRTIPVRVGVTATLIYNYGIEAWNIVNIFRPGLLGTREDFLREWCQDSLNGKGVVRNPDALGSYLRETLTVLRRTKKDVGQEAKQQAPHIEWVPPDTSGVAAAEELAQTLAIKTLSGSFTESGIAARDFDLKLREMTGIAKASQVAGYVRMFVETGVPVLLFGFHHEVYHIWRRELADLNPLFYTGRETQAQKEKNKKAFINGESDLLIMSLRSGAGADGIQKRCSTVVFGEFDWSPKVHEQCIGRVDRDDQQNEVFVFYAATQFGSDPEMIDTLGLKETQSRGIMDPGMSPINRQVDSDRIKRLARSFLNARGVTVPEAGDESQPSLLDLAQAI